MSMFGAMWFIVIGACFTLFGACIAADFRGLATRFNEAAARNAGASGAAVTRRWSVGATRFLGGMCVIAGTGVLIIGAFHL